MSDNAARCPDLPKVLLLTTVLQYAHSPLKIPQKTQACHEKVSNLKHFVRHPLNGGVSSVHVSVSGA
jgi:hypothetical protein